MAVAVFVVHVQASRFRPYESFCDQDVDVADFSSYLACVTGPAGESPSGCELFDFDGDNDVDLSDFGAFQLAFTGPQ